jgi:hypothetical protein
MRVFGFGVHLMRAPRDGHHGAYVATTAQV